MRKLKVVATVSADIASSWKIEIPGGKIMSLILFRRPEAATLLVDRVRLLATRHAFAATVLLVSSCSRAPTQNVMGSFFPAWMLCSLLGIISAVILRQALVLAGIHEYVLFPLAVYAACAGIGTMLIWLVWFGH